MKINQLLVVIWVCGFILVPVREFTRRKNFTHPWENKVWPCVLGIGIWFFPWWTIDTYTTFTRNHVDFNDTLLYTISQYKIAFNIAGVIAGVTLHLAYRTWKASRDKLVTKQ